jgi:hypothetical protein
MRDDWQVWQITKIGDDRYQIRCAHELDEDVNDVQFMGMLSAKGIRQSQVNEILSSLDAKGVGYKTEILFTPEPVLSAHTS